MQTADVCLQVASCSKQASTSSDWSLTPCWKLQSAPTSLLPANAYAPGSSNGTLVIYASLQDRSVHKYRLDLHAILMLKPKVRCLPDVTRMQLLCTVLHEHPLILH